MKQPEDSGLTWDDVVTAEHSAAGAVADLIKTKEDVLRIHRVIRGHVELMNVGRHQCKSIGGYLDYWDTPDFCEGYAKEISRNCGELDVLFREHNDMMELAAVRVPLVAIEIAAFEHAHRNEKKTGDPGDQGDPQSDAAITP